jgi:dUTP pyrophosphatase
MILKVKRLSATARLPAYSRQGDAGLDLAADETVTIEPGAAQLVKTGIAIELPQGTEAQIRPRSGLALKHGVTVLNTPGTIDEGYRGEIGVILINHGRQSFLIKLGLRIAQIVVRPVLYVGVEEVESLAETVRGRGGFGSTEIGGK